MAEERLPFLLSRTEIEYLLELVKRDGRQPDLIDLFTTGKKLMEEEL